MYAPVVSIGVLACNHAAYIGRTIDSILNQKTNFTYEIVIADDASDDGTKAIIESYQQKYPQQITFLNYTSKVGQGKAAKDIYLNCKGKYLAWLDGDDYWCNNEKLQKQIEFLENNPDYAGCFHDVAIETNSETLLNQQAKSQFRFYSQMYRYEKDLYPHELLGRKLIPTASLVFRNKGFEKELPKFKNINISLNWLIHLIIIKGSKFRYFNEVWAVYNDHNEGITKKVDFYEFSRSNIRILKILLKDDFYKKYNTEIYARIAQEYRLLLFDMKRKGLKRTALFKTSLVYVFYSLRLIFQDFIYFVINKK